MREHLVSSVKEAEVMMVVMVQKEKELRINRMWGEKSDPNEMIVTDLRLAYQS